MTTISQTIETTAPSRQQDAALSRKVAPGETLRGENATRARPAASFISGYDGMRAVACLMVFWYHARWRFGDPAFGIAGVDGRRLLQAMDSGVCIFFVLSGLLLSLPFWKAILASTPSQPLGAFFQRRVARIVPAYYAVLVILYLLSPNCYSLKGSSDLLLHALFIHTFFDFSYASINPVLWSIGIEFQFYLLLPLVMPLLARLSRTRLRPAGACLALVVASWLIGLAEPLLLKRIASPLPFAGLQTSGTILWYMQFFAAGITAGLAVASLPRPVSDDSGRRRSRIATAAGCAAALSFVVFGYLGGEASWRSVDWFAWPVNVAAIAILLWCVPASVPLQRILTNRALAFAGLVSYGLYLWHWPVQIAVAGGTLPGRFSGPIFVLVGGLISLAVSLLFASLSYYVIEVPGRRLVTELSFAFLFPVFSKRFTLASAAADRSELPAPAPAPASVTVAAPAPEGGNGCDESGADRTRRLVPNR